MPWAETGSHTYEAFDRLIDIPIAIASAYVRRTIGNLSNRATWVAVRIGSPEEASEWREKSRPFFLAMDAKNEQLAYKMIGGP